MRELFLDVTGKDPAFIPPIRLRQGEKGFPVSLTVTDDGEPYDLAGKAVRFMATRPDGHVVVEEVTEVAGNAATYRTPSALAAVPGAMRTAYFEIADSEGMRIAATGDIPIVIERGTDAAAEPAGDYIPELDRMLAEGAASIQANADALARFTADSSEQLQAQQEDFERAEAARDEECELAASMATEAAEEIVRRADAGEFDGPQGPKGDQGDPGRQGEKGDPGIGVPEGGKAGQVLVRTETGTEWRDAASADVEALSASEVDGIWDGAS